MNKSTPLIAALGIATVGGLVLAKKETSQSNTELLESAKTDDSRAEGKARKWAHDMSDIKQDEKVVYGTLPNGMRYVIQRNQLPPGRVSMRLHVDAGSLNEAEDQRGVAHFLEHMVFNGTKNFPDATKLIPQMQRLGIAFGAHANAYTSFDETVYMLDLPNNEKSTLDLAYGVMGDFADGALLTNQEIDEERGVIASEKTSRDSIGLRMMEKQFSELLPKSLLAKRFPIGTDEVIANAPRERFVDFYTRFYTPEKMTFILVGDIDVAAAEQRITDIFGGIKNPEKPGPKPSLGDLSTKKGFQTAVFTDKELTSTDVSLLRISKHDYKVDTKEKRAGNLPLSVANSIISRRFGKIAKEENSPIVSGSASRSVLFRELELGSIEVTAANDDWQKALPVLENEFRKANEFGFTQSEIDEVVANLINSYERQVETAPTRKSPAIASSLAQHIHGDYVYSTPETDLDILKENLKGVTKESVHKAFKDFWSTDDVTLVFSGKSAPENAENLLKETYAKAKENKVNAPEEKELGEFAYSNFGKAGTIKDSKHIEDLDLYQLTLSNGVKVNYKKTDFDKHSISMIARFGNGKLGMPKDKPGLDTLAGSIFTAGGLGKHSSEDLKTLLAGKDCGVGFGIDDDSFTLGGSTTPDDLELQLQLLAAYLTDPGFRPEAERQFKAVLPQIYAQLQHTQAGPMAKMNSWLHGEDGRFVFPEMEQAKALTTEDVKNWITPELNNSPLEISIVGDFDVTTLEKALCSTLGALPERKGGKELTADANVITPPETPAEKEFNFDSTLDTGVSIVLWKADDATDRDIKKVRRAGILSEILSDRLRVTLREKLGEAYSPSAQADLSTTFKNVGIVLAYSPGKPVNSKKVTDVIVELGAEFAEKGATQDELERALKPRLSMLAKTLRQNSYWLGSVMDQSQQYPDKLEWARSRDNDYQNIKLEEINSLAKKFLTKDRVMRVKIAPKN
ncbi:hypothetical protein Rhal01_00771 [Rubritalea halochordaticola]|uniref:Insulinase family protein n=1 Tax=Rubritalea halochordaticola TaxID=714537 RepID=A0ABP9UWK8_9BACT